MWKDYQSHESPKRKVLYKRDNRFLASVKKAFLVMNLPHELSTEAYTEKPWTEHKCCGAFSKHLFAL